MDVTEFERVFFKIIILVQKRDILHRESSLGSRNDPWLYRKKMRKPFEQVAFPLQQC